MPDMDPEMIFAYSSTFLVVGFEANSNSNKKIPKQKSTKRLVKEFLDFRISVAFGGFYFELVNKLRPNEYSTKKAVAGKLWVAVALSYLSNHLEFPKVEGNGKIIPLDKSFVKKSTWLLHFINPMVL